jgi:hypothetical protein
MAQQAGPAACPMTTPQAITASSLTLTNNNECSTLIFTSITPITVTLPPANTISPYFQAIFLPVYAGLTVSPSGTALINSQSSQVIGPGQSATLENDGTNWWFEIGGGFATKPAAFPNLGVGAGQTTSNSPTILLPNGTLQITNQASIAQATNGDAFAVCRGGAGTPLQNGIAASPGRTPAWWQILNPFGQPYRIPLC